MCAIQTLVSMVLQQIRYQNKIYRYDTTNTHSLYFSQVTRKIFPHRVANFLQFHWTIFQKRCLTYSRVWVFFVHF